MREPFAPKLAAVRVLAAPWLTKWPPREASPGLFARVDRCCDFFLQGWIRVARGLTSAAERPAMEEVSSS